jgi:hypothetical protein
MTTETGTDKIADIIREMLTERFHDEFVFSPIVVEPRIDHDGDEYLHTYIVFDGDQKRLDPTWTAGLSGRLWPYAEKLGFHGIPIQSFVEKSEWAEFFASKYRESSGSAQNR